MSRPVRTVWWIFGAAALVRLIALAVFPETAHTGDGPVYDRLAMGLLSGEGYVTAEGLPTAERPPLYACFLAGIFWLFGHRLWVVYLVQGLLDAGTCALIFLIGRRLLGPRAGLLGGLLAVPYLSLIAASRVLLTESLFVFLLLVMSWLLIKALERPHGWTLVGCGAVIGLAALTRAAALLLPIAAAVACLKTWGIPQGGRRAGLIIVGFLLVLTPWTLRNWRVLDAFIPVATQGGKVLYSSYRPPEGKLFGKFADDQTMAYAQANLSEVEASRFFVRETVDYVMAHPGELPRLVAQKIGFFWVPIDWELFGRSQGVWNAAYAFILPFALIGMWASRRQRDSSRWLWLLVGYFLLMSVMFYGSPRLRLPVEPCLLIWAGLGCARLLERTRASWVAVGMWSAVYLVGNLALLYRSQPAKQWLAGAVQWAGLW